MLHKSVNNINALSFLMLLRKDYEPHFFRFCTKEEAHNQWTRSPMQMEVRNVNSKNFVLTLKVWEEFVGNAKFLCHQSIVINFCKLNPLEDVNNVSLDTDSPNRGE